MESSLISYQNRVESPFIILTIGDYTFGHCAKREERNLLKVTFPNYMQSINVKKINGAVNTYTIRMTYQITELDDPNLLEKVFSSISQDRMITLQYGDWALPNYIYKDEKAILTKVSSQVDFANSKIDYTLTATSNALSITSVNKNFEAKFAKPSDEIKKLLKDKSTGLLDIFYGMKNLDDAKLNTLIVGDDKKVELKAQNCSVLSYINYLVSCMTSQSDYGTSALKSSRYFWSSFDDISNELGGPYFKVVRVDAKNKYNLSYDCYSVDIGYPSGNYVSSFSLDNNESWAILYNHAANMQMPEYTYDIDNDGKITSVSSPMITKSVKYGTTSESSKAWWSYMTQYPISAKLTIKGLLRPALLMSYVKINTYFFGRKHISSGLYIITKQEDQIDSSGYKTTLSITRISGDEAE